MLYDKRLLHPWFTHIFHSPVSYGGETAIVVALTQYRRETVLWILQKAKSFERTEARRPITHREHLTAMMSRPSMLRPAMLQVNDCFMHFPDSHYFYLREEGLHHQLLARFIREGLNPRFYGTGRIEDWCLMAFIQRTPKPFPNERDLRGPVLLTLKGRDEQIYIGQPLTLALGSNDHPMRRGWDDRHTGRTIGYYINAVELFDPCAHIGDLFAGDEELRRQAISTARSTCAEGERILLIKYECECDLQFYTRAMLDAPPANSAMSICFVGGGETGVKGYPLRTCSLGTVPLDFRGPVEVELLSRWLTEPDRAVGLQPRRLRQSSKWPKNAVRRLFGRL